MQSLSNSQITPIIKADTSFEDRGADYAIKDAQYSSPADTPLPLMEDTRDSQSRALAMRRSTYARGSGVQAGSTLINQGGPKHIEFRKPGEEG